MEYWAGDLDGALTIYEEQLELATQLGDEVGRADALLNKGFVLALRVEDVEDGRASREEAAAIYREHGDETAVLMLEWGETLNSSLWADHEDQAAAAKEVSERLEELGTPWHAAMALGTKAQTAFAMGDLAEAGRLVVQALRLAVETRDFGPATFSVEPFVAIMQRADEPESAALIVGALERIWLRYGIRPPRPFHELLLIPDPRLTLEESLGPERYAAAVARGQTMSDEQLIDYLEAELARIDERALDLGPYGKG